MGSVRKFFLLPGKDQRLLIKSAVLLTSIKLGLALLPFRTVRQLLGRIIRSAHHTEFNDPAVIKRVTWAVRVISQKFPLLKNCLTEALATQVLLKREGHSSTLRIGVARSDNGQLKAHAWVEVDGSIVIGGQRSPLQFVPLPPLEKR
jgi:hypothetical protein